jgi:hypothetical protein
MAETEYEKLQEALRKAPTEQARQAAAEALRRYLSSRQETRRSLGSKRKGSTPTIVSLQKLVKPYPTAVKIENAPDIIEKNPEYYKLMQKVITSK